MRRGPWKSRLCVSQRVDAATPIAGRRPDQSRFAGDPRRTSHIIANPEMAPQPTSAPVRADFLPSGIPIVETASCCCAATSVTAIALLDLDPTSLSAGSQGNKALTRSGDTTTRANPVALQPRFPSAHHASFQGCDNLTSVNSTIPFIGKTIPRLASKRFSQGYFCMSLSASSSVGN
jgi:hypothetical protein